MAETKTRSKSIGRDPSRSFKSLDSFKEYLGKGKKEQEKVKNTDDEQVDIALDCKIEKLSTLGELTSELDKKRIDGDNLDRIMKDLFKQYTDSKTIDDLVSERFLMINTMRNNKDLGPPANLKSTNKKIDLDRMTKLQRLFGNVPVFKNNTDFTIRELLNGLNAITENLGFDMTETEYELILNQKLSPRIKNAVRGYKHDSLKGLIANLLNIYDCSESHHEAFSAIVNQKSKFSNLHDFTEETLRLLSLSRKNSDQQSQLFVHSVQHILPKRVFEKLLEFLDSYEIIHKGKYPELPTLVDFIYKFKSEVDAHMAKNYKGPKYNFAQTNESEDEDETSGNNSFPSQKCSICNKNNHSTEKCFKTKQCNNCNSMGHIERYCNREKKCSKCNKSGHTVTTCFIRCRLCNSPAHGAVNCNIYPGIEPAQIACTNCSKSLFIKLYHPTNKCKIQKN